MSRRFLSLLLALVLLSPLCLLSAAPKEQSGMRTQMESASLQSTRMSIEFDQQTTRMQIASQEFGQNRLEGYGSILAINGYGTPTATVLDYSLGEAIESSNALDNFIAPASVNDLVQVGTPFIMHDLRMAAVNFEPVLRDEHGTLRAVTRLQVEISTQGLGGENTKENPTSFSQAYYPIYKEIVDNLDELFTGLTIRAPGRFIVIGQTRYIESDLPPTVHWNNWLSTKIRKGYHMQVVSLRQIFEAVGDSSRGGIRNYLNQTYHDQSLPDIEYVVLIGDTTGSCKIPTYIMANPEHLDEFKTGDNNYFTLDGNDYIPDILHGRISANGTSQLVAYFNKVFLYETDPDLSDLSWFSRASFLAGNFSDGGGTYPVTPVWNMYWARERLVNSGCITEADTFFYHGPSDPPPGQYRTAIRNDINSGVCAIFYRGWAAQPGWQYPVFNTDDLAQLSLGRRNPAVFGIVCGSGDFCWSNGPCLGETFTTVMGSVSNPNGAIVFYGATDIHTNTRHNNMVLAGIVDGLLIKNLRSTAQLTTLGELEAYRQYPRERDPFGSADNSLDEYYIFHVFNILGDPETQLYICQPNTFAVNHPASLDLGTGMVPVTVTAGGYPVENAVVTMRASGSAQVFTVLTDASGNASVPAFFPEGTTTAQLTVWKGGNFMEWIDIPVLQSSFDPQITNVNWSAGADNLPNPGETANFTLTVQYRGDAAANLVATVSSSDPRITVTSGIGTFGTVQPNSAATSSQISVVISPGVLDGEEPLLNVAFSGNGNAGRQFEVPIAAPLIIADSYLVDGNGFLDPGETASVTVTVTNHGHQDAANLTATVYSFDNSISFPANQLNFGAVVVGGTASATFQATLAAGVTRGRQIQLRYDMANNGTSLGVTRQWLSAGEVTTTAPTGPDEYGYYAYENIDAGFSSTPVYNWIELDPAHGGNGAEAHEVHDDSHFSMPLPVPFRYYGVPYDSVWICSNGWISFEYASIPEFRNLEMPSPIGAPSLVAVQWDDLAADRTAPNDDTLHYIWTRYDSGNDRFVIEWRTFNRRGLPDGGQPNEAFCNFEVILEFNGGAEGSMVFQYDQINSVDTRDNYATVGFEDSRHVRGMSLTFSNYYPSSVDTIRAGRAIRITTTPPDNFLGTDDPRIGVTPREFALHEAYPNPFNPSTELRFDLTETGLVSLKIYDVLGREVQTLVNEVHTSGSYSALFDGRSLSSGLYFARLSQGNKLQVQKLMLMK